MFTSGIALIIALFFAGNTQTVLLNGNIKKEVKSFVREEQRKKEILTLLQEYKKEVKELQKEFDKTAKELKKLNLVKNSPSDSLRRLMEKSLSLWKDIQLAGIPYRMKIQALILPQEWRKILSHPADAYNIDTLSRQQMIRKQMNAILAQPKTILKKYISDPFRATEALRAHKHLAELLEKMAVEYADTINRNLEVINNRQAEKEALEKAINSVQPAEDKIQNELIRFNRVLKEYTTNTEWYQIAKKMNRLY